MRPARDAGSGWGAEWLRFLGGSAHPTLSDTRYNDLFVCPGTATATTPPDVCVESGGNASVANAQEAMTATVAIP